MCQYGKSEDYWNRVKSLNDENKINLLPESERYRFDMSLHIFKINFHGNECLEGLQQQEFENLESQDVENSQINRLEEDELQQQLQAMQLSEEEPELMAMSQKEEKDEDAKMKDGEDEKENDEDDEEEDDDDDYDEDDDDGYDEDDEDAENDRYNNLKKLLSHDIAFVCPKAAEDDQQFALSYGYAQNMLFVSHEHDRILDLKGLMYLTPEIEELTLEQLENRYVELRQNTEDVRRKSSTLLEEIETTDDISALSMMEKVILCALIFELPYYQAKSLKFNPVPESVKSAGSYEKREIHFKSEQFSGTFYNADCLVCVANQGTSTEEEIGITRSYRDGGVVYTVKKFQNKYYIDKMVKNIPVLINRDYIENDEVKIEAVETIQ